MIGCSNLHLLDCTCMLHCELYTSKRMCFDFSILGHCVRDHSLFNLYRHLYSLNNIIMHSEKFQKAPKEVNHHVCMTQRMNGTQRMPHACVWYLVIITHPVEHFAVGEWVGSSSNHG